jgi:hypothetical protein
MATTENRNIVYLNKNFSDFRTNLIEFARTYFPQTYNDFTPASPGMMFMEMSAYIGDVMTFYLDNQIQENFIQYARQRNNVYALAYMLGYFPKATGVSTVDVDIYQQVPSILSGSTYIPDYNYTLRILENTSIASTTVPSSPSFLLQDAVDFSFSSSLDPTEVSIYQTTGNSVDYYLLKKSRPAVSAQINTTTFSFGAPQRYPTVEILDSNIIGILDITDSEGNKWYEVPYLGQEMVYDTIKNTNVNDPNFYTDEGDTPYLLRLKKIQRRFITRFISDKVLQIQFGAGTTPANNDEEITPNPDNVGLGLPYKRSLLSTAFSPANFLYTDTYGIAPYNTTLTVRYLVGGGLQSNINGGILNKINTTSNVKFNYPNLNANLSTFVFNSLTITNPKAASGGGAGDTIDEIKQKSLVNFTTQLRSVTQDDYLIRALSLPSDYGSVAKAYIEPEKISNLLPGETPSVLDLYILAYDVNKDLVTASEALKHNLKTYLSQYRIINDSIRIKDAFVINIGINFDLIILPQYNNNEVITQCILSLQNYFKIDNWQINQPIILRDLYILLDKIEGVQTVKSISISNKNSSNSTSDYSVYSYDISGATRNGIVYPSLDPMIFEVKFPELDIKGRVVPL